MKKIILLIAIVIKFTHSNAEFIKLQVDSQKVYFEKIEDYMNYISIAEYDSLDELVLVTETTNITYKLLPKFKSVKHLYIENMDTIIIDNIFKQNVPIEFLSLSSNVLIFNYFTTTTSKLNIFNLNIYCNNPVNLKSFFEIYNISSFYLTSNQIDIIKDFKLYKDIINRTPSVCMVTLNMQKSSRKFLYKFKYKFHFNSKIKIYYSKGAFNIYEKHLYKY